MTRTRAVWLSGVVLLSAVALLVGAVAVFTDDDPDVEPAKVWDVRNTPVGVSSIGSAPGFQTVDRISWFGDELAVWGIEGEPGDDNVLGYRGASLDPATGTWKTWPMWPFPDPLYAAANVWTDHELVVVGTACDAPRSDGHDEGEYIPRCSPGSTVAAAYDPAARQWTRLPAPPTRHEEHTAFGWTGTRAVFLFGLRPDQEVLGLDPANRTWTSIPPRPEPFPTSRPCQLDGAVLSIGPLVGTDPLSVQSYLLVDDDWQPLPVLRTPPTYTGITSSCGGSDAIATFGDWSRAWRWVRTTNTWNEIPTPAPGLTAVFAPLPLPQPIIHPGWTGTDFVWSTPPASIDPTTHTRTRTGGGLTYQPQNQTWSSAAPGPDMLEEGNPFDYSNWRHGVGVVVETPTDFKAPLQLVAYRPS